MSSVRFGRPTGRNTGVGLPSTPRARSVGRYDLREKETERYRDRDRDREYNSYRDTPAARSRSANTRRSIANPLPLTRGGLSSYTDVPDVPPLPLQRHLDVSPQSSISSGSSLSASGPSMFLDRIKGRSGYVSSRTSMEDEFEPRKDMRHEHGSGVRYRTTVVSEPETGRLKGFNLRLIHLYSRLARARRGRRPRIWNVTLVTRRRGCEWSDRNRVKGVGI
jgi:hypothetical protein